MKILNTGGLRRAGRVLAHSARKFVKDDGPQWAAAIAYYTLLSLFPLVLVAASLASTLVEPGWAVAQVLRVLGEYVPRGGDAVGRVVAEAIEARGGVSVLSLATLLWSGTRVFGVMTRALNVAMEVQDPYGFWHRMLLELLMFVTLGVLFLLALLAQIVVDVLGAGAGSLPGLAAQVTAPGLLLALAFFLIYRWVPRRKVGNRAALAGAGVAAVLIVAARPAFRAYVEHFASYSLIYGSLAAIISIVVWAWWVSVILLFGGEVALHTEAALRTARLHGAPRPATPALAAEAPERS